MVSPKPLLIGLTLLALGGAGFVYNLTRPQPPVTWAEPEVLPTAAPDGPVASPSPIPIPPKSPQRQRVVSIQRGHSSAPTVLPTPPVIRWTSPQQLGDTYTAPATIELDAEVIPSEVDVSKVEFFVAEASSTSRSFCNSVKDIQLPGATLTRLAEVVSPPYQFSWENVEAGAYIIYGIVTDARGVRQISQPRFIKVNKLANEEERKGWQPPYHIETLTRPQPQVTPTPEPILAAPPVVIVGPSDELEEYEPLPDTTSACLSVVIEGPSEEWQEGEPLTLTARVKEANSGLRYNWKLSAGRVISGQGTNTITLDTSRLGGQVVQVSLEVFNPQTLCAVSISHQVKVFQSLELEHSDPPGGESLFSGLNDLAFEIRKAPKNKGYIIAYGGATGCDGEAVFVLREAKKYLVDVEGVKAESIVAINGGYDIDTRVELFIVPPSAIPPEPDPSFQADEVSTRRCSTKELSTFLYQDQDVRQLDAPYPKCPNVSERVDYDLTLYADASHLNICPYNLNDPQTQDAQINLHTKALGVYGNKLTYQYWTNGGQVISDGANARWDLSAVRLQPGYYTAVVAATDECGCTTITSTSVLLTNYCTPCLSVFHVCPETPEQSRISMRFKVEVPEWALEGQPTYQWRVSNGTIIQGQETSSITVDTSKLSEGTEVTATVEVGGLYQYCLANEVATAIVGQGCQPGPRKIDEYGNINFDRGLRRAKTAKQGQKTRTTSESELTGGEDGQTSTRPPPTKSSPEREYMNLAWPKLTEIQRSATIIVRYQRETATLNLSNEQGDVTEQLNLPRLLKDRYGPDYEVWANVKLRSAGFSCPTCNEEQYQSLDNAQLEWSWNIISERGGTQTFNVELWVEGRQRNHPREKRPPEKVWSRNNLELSVEESQPTRNTIIASSALFCLLGLGLSLKGINIHIGDKIMGDKFRGDKITGDKVIGHKGDIYNVERGVGVGRQVNMEETEIDQNGGEAEDG